MGEKKERNMTTRDRTELGAMVNELIKEAHSTAKEKGWYDSEITVPHSFMMIVDEITEAMHEYRNNGKTEEFTCEIADVFIRLFDFLGKQEIKGDVLVNKILEKMHENKSRPHRHGNKPF